MRLSLSFLLLFLPALPALAAEEGAQKEQKTEQVEERQPPSTAELCEALEAQAVESGLPGAFFVRLIWKESRFNPGAVSPKGAQGIAQFMPATAAERGLEDPFDPMQAIAASAAFLADLAFEFGNLGLAAAAYNAGSERVRNWLAGTSSLPWETRDFVLFITGRPAEAWKAPEDAALPEEIVAAASPLQEWCRKLPTAKPTPIQMAAGDLKAAVPRLPWGVQLAAHFSRSNALAMYGRVKADHASLLGKYDPIVIRDRSSGISRRARFAVRIGFDSRAAANAMCNRLRAKGGACMVAKN